MPPKVPSSPSAMTVKQLKTALKKRKIDFDAKAKKAELVELLESAMGSRGGGGGSGAGTVRDFV